MMRRAVLTLCTVFAITAASFAQSTARINGRVLDQAGAVLPGASVTVTETATGVARDTVTNGEGLYSVPALNPGTYSVKIELPGFAPQTRSGVVVLTAATVTLDITLGLAQVQESVTVSAESPLVETTQAVVGNSVQQREVQAIPMLNRTVAAMITLVPGAREVTMATRGAHGQASNFVSLGGGSGASANMLVDGLDNKEDSNGGSLLSYSLEGVQKFNQFTAQYISFTHDSHYPQCPLSPIYLWSNLGNGACLPEKLVFPTVSTGQLQSFPIGWLNLDNKLELKEDFSKQAGRHAFKAGGSYMFNPINGGAFGGGGISTSIRSSTACGRSRRRRRPCTATPTCSRRFSW